MRPLREKKITVIIGPPGSGKTTSMQGGDYAGYVRFDADRIIEVLWGELKFHPCVKHTAKTMVRQGLRKAMRYGLNIVVQISGRTRGARAKIINLAREYDYEVTIVYLSASPDVCLARCEADDGRPATTDWKPIIDHWFEMFEPVEDDECDNYIEEAA
jgi:predicted kinase